MRSFREVLGLVVVCVLLILFAVAGLVWDFATGLELNIDGLLLLLVCLMIGGLFTLMLFLMAKEMGWLLSRRKSAEGTANPAKPAGQGN